MNRRKVKYIYLYTNHYLLYQHSQSMMYNQCFQQIPSKSKTLQALIHPKWLLTLNTFAQSRRRFSRGKCLHLENSAVTLQNVFSDINRERVKKLLPATRLPPRPGRSKEVKSQAAVLIPLCVVDGQPCILLMKRSVHLNSHSGEICFPGGMKDETDTDLKETAFRETYEEIGLPSDHVEFWEQMTPFPSKRAGNWVTPVVGLCRNIDLDKLQINKSEVEKVFTVTIESLCNPTNQRQTQWRYPGSPGYTLPVFLIEEYRIWGLTAVILHMFLPLLAPDLYKFKLKHRR